MNYIIGQIITLLSYLIYWSSRFFKKKKSMLIVDNISKIIRIIAFLVLGTYDGMKSTLFAFFKNIDGQLVINKKKVTKEINFIFLLIILLLMYVFDFNGISTLCIAICGILNLYGAVMCDEKYYRILGMIGSIFYTLFMLFTLNYVGCICEIICIIVMIISYIKFRRLKFSIAIDIDDTLTNIREDIIKSAINYSVSLNKNIDIDRINETEAFGSGEVIKKAFDFTDEELVNYLKHLQNDITTKVKARKNASEVINKLHEKGYTIYIVTARSDKYLSDPYEISKEWLDNNNIYYDYLIVNAANKGLVCKEKKIDILIDDSLENCKKALKEGIKAIHFCSKKTDTGFKEVSSWLEVYNYFK